MIDVDPNNNLTDFFLRYTEPTEIEARNVKHLFSGEISPEECVHESTGLSVIPCTVSLHTASHELSRSPATVLRFAALLRKMDYDVVLIDTPPFPGYELALALHASDMILSPVALSRWTVQAYTALDTEIKTASDGTGRIPESLILPALVTQREETILRNSMNGTAVTASVIHRAAATTGGGQASRRRNQRFRSRESFVC